jgi:hypothetical protein
MSGWRKRQIQEKHMTKDEAFLMAIEALDNADYHRADEAITAIKAALEAKDEPVGKLQEPTVERAWFTIAELNAWADKKLLENPQWVMPKDEPERDEPPPQRTWVGLTDEEWEAMYYKFAKHQEYGAFVSGWDKFAQAIEAKLKEKNT